MVQTQTLLIPYETQVKILVLLKMEPQRRCCTQYSRDAAILRVRLGFELQYTLSARFSGPVQQIRSSRLLDM
jgi:hypothetical protein